MYVVVFFIPSVTILAPQSESEKHFFLFSIRKSIFYYMKKINVIFLK